MAVTLLPSKPYYSPWITCTHYSLSPDVFKLQFQPEHTSQFLHQAQDTGFSGFMEGQLGADPAFGSCLQCAAIDRARYKTNPVTPRSDVCSKCFKKYCFDPADPPPEGQIVGRKIQFKNTDPSAFATFFEHNKTAIIAGASVAAFLLIATIVGCVAASKRAKVKKAAYQRLARDGSEWSAKAGSHSYEMSGSRR